MAKRNKAKKNLIKRFVNSIKNSSQPKLTATFVILGFIIGSVYAYHGIDAYYHSIRNYVAYENNFKIHFPGKPNISNLPSASTLPGATASSRLYDYKDQSKNQDYEVKATTYINIDSTSLSKSSLTSLLNASLSQDAKDISASISSPNSLSFEGLMAVQAILVTAQSSSGTNYVITFVSGHTLYNIESSGLSLVQFNKFADSFKFVAS